MERQSVKRGAAFELRTLCALRSDALRSDAAFLACPPPYVGGYAFSRALLFGVLASAG